MNTQYSSALYLPGATSHNINAHLALHTSWSQHKIQANCHSTSHRDPVQGNLAGRRAEDCNQWLVVAIGVQGVGYVQHWSIDTTHLRRISSIHWYLILELPAKDEAIKRFTAELKFNCYFKCKIPMGVVKQIAAILHTCCPNKRTNHYYLINLSDYRITE